MSTAEQINDLASLHKSENAQVWLPQSWKEIVNKPVWATIRQLDHGATSEKMVSVEEFKRRVDGLRFQLIENWCLCKYCQLYDSANENYGHWVAEFCACANYLRSFEVKGRPGKRRTVWKMFVDDYDYNQERKILGIIRDKFGVENILDMSKRNEVATTFVKSINGLIDVLTDVRISVADYVQTTLQ